MDKSYELTGNNYNLLGTGHSDNDYCTEPRTDCEDVSATTEPTCISIPIMPTVVPEGNVIVKIPVVLAEIKVQIPTISDITLQNEAVEIKSIKKNVYVTQCKVLPEFADNTVSNMALLSLEGFVRKNIEYATRTCNSDEVISGNIQHTTVQVSFSCTTPVTFAKAPVLMRNSVSQELEFFEDTLKRCDPCEEPVIGKEPCEQNFFNSEFFNGKIFCELVQADIVEVDIHRNIESLPEEESCENPTEQVFTQVKEKMIVNITLKILQNQQIRIKSLGSVVPSC